MKAHEMTAMEYAAMMHRAIQWNGSVWHIGKPITKKTFAAMYPNTSQTQSSNETPEYETDQQALAARHEKEFTEMIRKDALKYRKEAGEANKTDPESSKE